MSKLVRESFELSGRRVAGRRHGPCRLNRPRSANALNTQMSLDLMTLFEGLQIDPDAPRCLVVTGDGEGVFWAGGDLVERLTMSDEQ